MASWAELLTLAGPGEHVVQLYGEDDQLLARNVSRYLAEGLRRGDGLVVIGTPEHTEAVARHLVEEAGVRVPGDAYQLVIDGVVLDDPIEELCSSLLQLL